MAIKSQKNMFICIWMDFQEIKEVFSREPFIHDSSIGMSTGINTYFDSV